MSYRESFSNLGRASPYASLSHNDRNFSDMFEYVNDDDYRREAPIEDDDAPDVLNIRAANNLFKSFKAEFSPFSISESRIFVSDLRRHIARVLNEDPRKICLYYKDRELRNDASPLKFYGCKQNSEIIVNIEETFADYNNDHHSSEEDAHRKPTQVHHTRDRANSSVRDRQKAYYDDNHRSSNASGFLHPEEHPSTRPRRTYSTSRPAPTTTRINRDSSPANPTPSATSLPPSPRRPSRPVDPNSAMGKVFALRDKFYDTYYPEARRFLDSPPKDQTVRQNAYNQVVENLMKHVIETADGITTGDDKEARAERKKVVMDAQEVLKQLDAAHKSWSR